MTEFEFEEGQEPAIRRAMTDDGRIDGWSCPFCGASNLLVSYGDIALDTERVEVYCDNNLCDVRRFVVLVTRGAPQPNVRADVLALHRVDQGTEAEQNADGFEILRDEDGEAWARASSLRERTGHVDDLQERRRRKVERRRREAKITVTPVVREGDDRGPYGS